MTWLVIKKPTREDALAAYAAVTLSWAVRSEHRGGDDTLHVLLVQDWKTGPKEFVEWVQHSMQKAALARRPIEERPLRDEVDPAS
jgi:hypothetical protein